MSIHSEAQLDRKILEMLKLLNIYLNHFPHHEKYGLAQQIRQTAYDMYGFVIEAQKRYHKKTALSSMDVTHEKLRMFIRLAYELGYFSFKDSRKESGAEQTSEHRYVAISRIIDEIGRMIGGWVVAARGEKVVGEAS